jgi:tRNA(Glu) U13 pseudouridine synthase TruD
MSANVNKSSEPLAPAAPSSLDPEEEEAIRYLEQLLGEKFPPLIREARAAFRRDLPELLKRHRGKWVAYSGSQRLGIGRSKTTVYQECLQRGLEPGTFLVTVVQPETPREVDV